MKTLPTDHRTAHAARAALEAQRAARTQDAARAEELENARRLQEARAHREHEELVRESAGRGRRREHHSQRPVVLSTALAIGGPSPTTGSPCCNCGWRSRTARSRV